MPHSYNETATSSAASFPVGQHPQPAHSHLPPYSVCNKLSINQFRSAESTCPTKQPTVIKNSVPSPPWDSAFRPAFLPLWRCFWEYQVTFAPSRDSRPLKPWKMGVGTAENATREKGVIREPTPAQNSSFFWDRKRRGRGGKGNVYPVRISSAFLRSATEFWVPLFRGGWGGGGYIF